MKPQMLIAPVTPRLLLAGALALWVALGAWIVLRAPFASGTDESIRYVAFAAAKNRWATQEDFERHGIEQYYYPPLYFLLFAPFHGDDPAFVEGYPADPVAEAFAYKYTGRVYAPAEYYARVPPSLLRLYRQAKSLSLFLGVAVLLSLVGTLRLLFRGRAKWWMVLAGAAPAVLLPQLLYYQTLCNNDALVNALGALAIFATVGALTALRLGRERAFLLRAAAAATCVGLALLTKMSGMALVVLLPGLAGAWFLHRRGRGLRARVAGAGGVLALLAAAAIAAGGWWLLYKAAEGDWSSQGAHRLAHPWAFRETFPPDALVYLNDLFTMARSYFALFGSLVGIPDAVFLVYLAIPLTLLLAASLAVLRHHSRGGRRTPRSPRRRLRAWTWGVLAATVAVNAGLALANLAMSHAPYGRLLFPSLVASHALFALLVARAAGSRPASRARIAALLLLLYGGLFAWTFRHRMVPAVEVRQENFLTLAYLEEGYDEFRTLGRVWEGTIRQPLLLPPGVLTGLRVPLIRYLGAGSSHPKFDLPQIGCALEGFLRVDSPGAPPRRFALKRASLGSGDATDRWLALELESPAGIGEESSATLVLWGTRPWLVSGILFVDYLLAPADRFPRVGPVAGLGSPGDRSICVAAVYRDPLPPGLGP